MLLSRGQPGSGGFLQLIANRCNQLDRHYRILQVPELQTALKRAGLDVLAVPNTGAIFSKRLTQQ